MNLLVALSSAFPAVLTIGPANVDLQAAVEVIFDG
jgi:hypothetical protein